MCDASIGLFEDWLGCPLTDMYKTALASHGGSLIGDRVLFYAVDELIERNSTFETNLYCPQYFTIGDDSGGMAVMIAKTDPDCRVYLVDHGSMAPDTFHFVAPSLLEWIGLECPLPRL
jgi:hypothetical protein